MWRRLAVLLLAATAAVPALGAGSCGDHLGNKVEGEPCNRTDECLQGLTCTMEGVCGAPGPPDGGTD